jgi:DNA-binding NtrC family response regulator
MQSSIADRDRRILIAVAEQDFAATLQDFLGYTGFQIERSADVQGVLRVTGLREFDVIVLDLELLERAPAGTEHADIGLVSFIRQKSPQTRIVLLFDLEQMEKALEGLRQGAFFYLPRTSSPSDVGMAVEKAVRSAVSEATVDAFEQTLFEAFAGQSPAMQRAVQLVKKVAPTDSTVLLLGESGTGKEVVANTLHRLSRRKEKPFVAINCAALPEALLESEMFGHVKGAFTGADRDKRGLFEEADGGTIFLDEIGDMSPVTQAKLLRVLQNGEIRRVGSSVPMLVNVRVIAATHRDLIEGVRRNTFREDLYFRLNVIQIRIPPLRERMDALPSLIAHFLNLSNARYGKQVTGVDEGALSLLSAHDFPGNVRELESTIAHAVIMAEGQKIRAEDLPDTVRHGHQSRLALPFEPANEVLTLTAVEEQAIRRALDVLNGNQSLAAKRLGISRSTLWRKMNEYGIPR